VNKLCVKTVLFLLQFSFKCQCLSVMWSANLPEHKLFPLNIDSVVSVWGFSCIRAAQMACALTYRLQCIQTVSDLPLCVLQSFCMCLKAISCHLPLSACFNWRLDFQMYGQTLLCGLCLQAEGGVQKPYPGDTSLVVSVFSTLLIYIRWVNKRITMENSPLL